MWRRSNRRGPGGQRPRHRHPRLHGRSAGDALIVTVLNIGPKDRLVGGPGDGLLIGGRTIHDNDAQALRKILHSVLLSGGVGPRAIR